MAWIELTSTALKELMAGPEFSAVTSAAKGTGQDAEEMVENVIARVVKMARGYIGAKRAVGPEGTIPDEVEAACLAMARVDVLTRLPGLKHLLTDERKSAAKDGLSLLKAVGRGEFVIVETDEPAEDQPAAPRVSVISTREPRQTHEGLRRLF